jgi:hypothetical protein
MHRIFPNLYRFDFGPRGTDNRMSKITHIGF